VAEKSQAKQRRIRQGQRIGVEPRPPAALAQWPRRWTRVNALLLFRRIKRPRLGRSLLPQLHRQQHVHAHLQEFAFPVLERGRDEVAAGQVLRQRFGQQPLFDALGIADLHAGQHLANQEDEEQRQQHQ
jgi:hypothetical protein